MATDVESIASALADGEMSVHGRLAQSSNSALIVNCRQGDVDVLAVYKPVAGERPLHDFPDGTLAHREIAAAIMAQALGWNCVPLTQWREDGPAGPGICQQWIDADEARATVGVFGPDDVPGGWCEVLTGVDQDDRAIVVAHDDDMALRRLALFDVVINNADRKGGHILRTEDGATLGIDHGVTFAIPLKLRTVLWGFAGQPIDQGLIGDLGAISEQAWSTMAEHLTDAEIEATQWRISQVRDIARYPLPSSDWPAVPWPVF